jgi:hypothetical protein
MSSTVMPTSDPLIVVRYLDVIVVVLAAPFVILTGAPVIGYLVALVCWVATRFAGAAIERHAATREDPRAVVGLNFGALLGRAWLLGIAVLAVGLIGSHKDGLMAAVTLLVAFTIYFATNLIIRPLERNSNRP